MSLPAISLLLIKPIQTAKSRGHPTSINKVFTLICVPSPLFYNGLSIILNFNQSDICTCIQYRGFIPRPECKLKVVLFTYKIVRRIQCHDFRNNFCYLQKIAQKWLVHLFAALLPSRSCPSAVVMAADD